MRGDEYEWKGRAGLKEAIPDVPPPGNTFQLFLGDPEKFPSQMEYIIFPANSGSILGSPPSWPCPVNSKGTCPGGTLIRCLNHLNCCLILFISLSPTTLWKNHISATSVQSAILSITTCSSRP